MVTSPMTWAEGSTQAPGWTRGMRQGALRIMGRLLPGPAGLPLLEEGAHALAEVGARVGQGDQVLAAFKPAALLDAADGLLGDLPGDRRVGGDLLGDGLHARPARGRRAGLAGGCRGG